MARWAFVVGNCETDTALNSVDDSDNVSGTKERSPQRSLNFSREPVFLFKGLQLFYFIITCASLSKIVSSHFLPKRLTAWITSCVAVIHRALRLCSFTALL